MDSSRIYVTGFIGSRRKQLAQELAKQYDYEYIDIDKLIEASDGRSIRKICMMDGEHGYRNKEYEVLKSLEDRSEFVAVCSDGIALDDMCADILKQGRVYIADEDLSTEKLWEQALSDREIPYAFLMDRDYDRFCSLYDIRKHIYQDIREGNQMKEPVLIIMAAGMGSRYGGLKQMDKITEQGEIILDFSLYDAYMAGFKKAVIVIKEEMQEDFEQLIKGRADKYMEIEYTYQSLEDIPKGFEIPADRVKPWGTGHAVLAARNIVDGPFAVINADDFYGAGAFLAIYEFLEQAEDDYCMVAYKVENTLSESGYVSRGVCDVDSGGYLADINERTKIMWHGEDIVYEEGERLVYVDKGTPVSMNFWGFTADFMKQLENRFPEFLKQTLESNPQKGEYFLPGVVDEVISEGIAKVKVLSSADKWYGVTYKEDKESVTAALQSMKDKGIYPDKLWK